MKREMELVIKILEYLETREEISIIQDLEIPGYDNNVVAYHIRRMYEAGFLDAETITSTTTDNRLISVLPFGLTWQGHEFLDAIRNRDVKEKVLKKLGGAFSQVPFILINELALSFFRKQLGL